MKNLKGTFILLLTAFIWGTAFVAQTSAKDSIGTFTFNALRNIIAAAFLFLFINIRDVISGKITRCGGYPVKEGIICGIVLCISMTLQQMGINNYPEGVAVSGRAGFLTATYVVMVSVAVVFAGQKLHKIVIAAVCVCIAGMYLLCMSDGLNGIYISDMLELLCAVGFTAHILVVDRYSYTDGVKLSCIQFLTSGIISAAGMVMFEQVRITGITGALIPILYAGVMSSGVGYTLQIIGQKYARPSVTAIVLSLESVFAALAGWVLLSEHLTGRETTGCILVFAAVIMAQIPQFSKTNVSDSKASTSVRK